MSLSGGGNNLIRGHGGTVSLTNINDVIAGGGVIGGGGLTLINSGTVNANAASPLTISTGNTVTNSGTLEATSGGDLVIDDNVKNSKVIEALGAGAAVTIGRRHQQHREGPYSRVGQWGAS